MNEWFKSLAIVLVLGCGAPAALAESSSMVEYGSPAKQLRAPVIINDREESSTGGDIPSAVSEYRNVNQSPYVTEFGRTGRPVSSQPPTVRPTASSPHIQEFGALPADTFAPTFEGGPTFSRQRPLKFTRSPNSVRRHLSHASRPQAIAYKEPAGLAHARLIPVHVIQEDELAVYPAGGHNNGRPAGAQVTGKN